MSSELANKSVQAAIAAIEIYYKPNFSNHLVVSDVREVRQSTADTVFARVLFYIDDAIIPI
ncbi:MAG: hypothetical protein U1F04_02500 [Burkholderiaceae bacterium]